MSNKDEATGRQPVATGGNSDNNQIGKDSDMEIISHNPSEINTEITEIEEIRRLVELAKVEPPAPETGATDHQGEPEQPAFRRLSFDDLMNMPPKQWLIENLVGRRDLGMLYGAPGTGKSFVAIDLAFAAITASQWADTFDIAEPLTVAYCAGEGISGLRDRFQAAAAFWTATPADLARLWIYDITPQFHATQSAVSAGAFVRETLRTGQAPDLVIIDTLHSAIVGADENSAKDAGYIIDAARMIARDLDCAVLFVHHANKAGTGDRGSSAFRGAMDYMIEIRPSRGDKRDMVCSKIKDAPPFDAQTFQLVAKGPTSARVDWLGSAKDQSGGRDDSYRAAILDILKENPTVRLTARRIAEAAGISQQHASNLLRYMCETGTVERMLSDPNKQNSRRNPWTYRLINGDSD